jgi:hypothetical protein
VRDLALWQRKQRLLEKDAGLVGARGGAVRVLMKLFERGEAVRTLRAE